MPDHIKPDLIRRISPSDRIVREIIYRIVNFRYLMETLAMSDRWLSVEEIAEYLGVSKDTVYAWISKRNMPAHRIGRLWKFKSEEVDEWVRSGGAAENEGRGKE
ncbi:methylation-associated defense system helix-turn-helix domain-containing protein MAD1 [Xanthomonas campestris]|uniref:methylation-associated defense system helix-turn-helix domain-containing protein MAD1 n=1 Tax=Xanthomonas campestris TaxID=339 RepID=UPI003CCFE573